jgi:hypothetical protein
MNHIKLKEVKNTVNEICWYYATGNAQQGTCKDCDTCLQKTEQGCGCDSCLLEKYHIDCCSDFELIAQNPNWKLVKVQWEKIKNYKKEKENLEMENGKTINTEKFLKDMTEMCFTCGGDNHLCGCYSFCPFAEPHDAIDVLRKLLNTNFEVYITAEQKIVIYDTLKGMGKELVDILNKNEIKIISAEAKEDNDYTFLHLKGKYKNLFTIQDFYKEMKEYLETYDITTVGTKNGTVAIDEYGDRVLLFEIVAEGDN